MGLVSDTKCIAVYDISKIKIKILQYILKNDPAYCTPSIVGRSIYC